MLTGTTLAPVAAAIKPMKVGSWGFATGLDISADASRKLMWGDVCVPYIKDTGDKEWRRLLTTDNMPQALYDPRPDNYSIGLTSESDSTYAARLAPSSPNIVYCTFNARLLRVDIAANTVVQLGLPAMKLLGNAKDQRLWNDKLAVHPTNPNIVALGTMENGVQFTTNANLGASSTFTQVSGITAGTANDGFPTPHLVAFDEGDPNYFYATKHGTGVYRATAGIGSAMSLIPNGPTTVRQMEVLSDGRLACLDISTNKVWTLARGSGSTWTQSAAPSFSGAGSFAFDKNDLDKLTVYGLDGPTSRSLNGGGAWIDTWYAAYPGPIGQYYNATDVPELGNFSGGVAVSRIKHDGTSLWVAFGKGVGKTTPPNTLVRWDTYDETAGIDMLGFTRILSIPGNPRVQIGTYDKGMIRPIDLDRYTMQPRYTSPARTRVDVEHLYGLDYASGAPDYVAYAMGFNNRDLGRSYDGGKTLSVYPNQHPDGYWLGGMICSTGPGKAIFIPGNNGKAIVTLNDGATPWQYLNLPGAGTQGQGSWIASAFSNRKCIAADKERPGHALVITRTDQTPGAGAFKTENHGETWATRFTGQLDPSNDSDPSQFYRCTLEYIPGRAGELLYTDGPGFQSAFRYSADDGASWASLRGGEVFAEWFSFGETLPGFNYPVLWFRGTVGGVRGIYFSHDFLATTPRLISRFPLKSVSEIASLGADRNKWSRCYFGFAGGGGGYIDLSNVASGS